MFASEGTHGMLNQKPRKLLTGCSLGILIACLAATGCSSRPNQSILSFFSKPDLSASGFKDLLSQLGELPADEKQQQLQSFADHASDPTVAQKASYILARQLQSSSRPSDLKEAIRRFLQAGHLAALSKLSAWHSYECALKLGDEKLARSILETIAQNDPDKHADALYALGQSYMRTGESAEAKQYFEAVCKAAPSSQFALGATYYLAEMQLNDKQTPGGQPYANSSSQAQPDPFTAALASLRHYLASSPDGRFAASIADQLRGIDNINLSAADHNLLAQVYFLAGNYKLALDEWHKAGNTSQWYKQSLALIRLGRTQDAKSLLNQSLKNYPDDPTVPKAASTLCRMLNHNDSIAVWTGILHRTHKFGDAALYNLGLRADTPAAALPFYRKVMSQYPASAYAPESAWWVGWASARAGKSKDALSVWKTAATRYPDAHAAMRMLFWQGKMWERLGQKAAAKQSYLAAVAKAPAHYYAHRARARLSALAGGKDQGWATDPNRKVAWKADRGDWQFPDVPANFLPRGGTALSILTELRQWDECLNETTDKSAVLRAFFLAKLNMPHEAINAAGQALHGPPQPTELWQLAYPLLYARTIAAEAASKNVDPYLVQALVREESRYDHDAISSSHALGLMQLLPATAYGVARRLGIPVKAEVDFFDPDKNLRMGIDYLSYTLKRFKGNALFAIAGYNGGPNAVQRWASAGSSDPDAFVENIPFSETRDYVRKVFSSYWNYQCVYAVPASANKPRPAAK